jgi:nucleotide-binding universal stress UspA family protein
MVARAPYGRPAIAVDLDQTAYHAVDVMLRILPPPRPRVAVIHAFDPPYQGWATYRSLSHDDAEDEHEELAARASRKVTKLIATAMSRAGGRPTDGPMWKLHVQLGAARFVIKRAVRKLETDLLVLGTHGYTGVAHLFLGTVAGDVLREVACDVLVVPPRRTPA